jgi:transcription elongation GreA/GreB family factor
MSVAFVREESAETAAEIEFPDRLVSPHPNLVTAAGLKALENAVAAAQAAFEPTRGVEDANKRPRTGAAAARDLKYFNERLKTAQVVPAPPAPTTVAFGTHVTFKRDDGRRQSFRIVGEDEADPRNGSISYVSPVARALAGKAVGEFVAVADHEIEILAIA